MAIMNKGTWKSFFDFREQRKSSCSFGVRDTIVPIDSNNIIGNTKAYGIGQSGIVEYNATSIWINNQYATKPWTKAKRIDIKAWKPGEVGRVSEHEWAFGIIYRVEESLSSFQA